MAKDCIALSMVENPWLRRLVLLCDARIMFPTCNQLMNEHFPNLLATTMEHYIYPLINSCEIVTVTFDLWMSRVGYDTFAAVVNFVDKSWVPQHVTMGLFDAPKTSEVALAEIDLCICARRALSHRIHTDSSFRHGESYRPPSNYKTLEIL